MLRPDEELPLSPQKPVAEDVDREVADHLERRAAELIADGWPADAARAEARRIFGDVGAISSECRHITVNDRRSRRRAERFDGFLQDLRFAFRLLRRSPTFAVVAVVTLALGVGANTAIFSLINGALLKPLPYDQSQQLVDVIELHQKGWGHLAYSTLVDVRRESTSFQGIASYGSDHSSFIAGTEPLRATGTFVTSDFFQVMRARPELGRLTGQTDHQYGAAPVAVISDRFWHEHYGGNRDLAALKLKGEFPLQVVGVMAPGFGFPDNTDVWIPAELERQPLSHTAHSQPVVARLKSGVSIASAQQELNTTIRHVGETAGVDFDAIGTRVISLQQALTGSARTPLLLLLGASGLLLLTACTNLASTLLARGTARGLELAVRTAIGAGRGRVIRQILTESIVIATLGCGVGLIIAEGLLRGVSALGPPELGLLQQAELDWRVLGFTAAIALLTALLFGLMPALRLSDTDSGQLMRGSRGAGTRRGSIWSVLVAVEVALAVVLLIGSGLLLHSFARVMSVELGFDPAHVTTAAVDLPNASYPDVAQAVTYHDRALALIRAIPGAEAAGATNALPLDGGPNGGMEVEGKPPLSPARKSTAQGVYRLASTGFFASMGLKIVRGRDFAESDDGHALMVAIVNQTMAEKEWPGADPIGKRFRPSSMDALEDQPWATVVGVVHDVPGNTITSPAEETYYFSYRQLPFRARWLTTTVRSALAPGLLQLRIQKALAEVDPQVAVEFGSMSAKVAASVADRRFMVLLLGLFAAVALLLAAVGIYGVVAYSVAQRTREIGIRIALGAAPRGVGRMVQLGAMRMVLGGTILGVFGALAATRLLQSLLYGTRATDPMAFGVVIVLLIVTAWIASWAPARRSTRIDPIAAIRSD